MEELGRERERNEGGVSKREKMVKTWIKRVVPVIGYVYTGPAEYLVGHILGQLSSRPKKKSLRHCVYTGPVSQVYDMRTAPNLLQAKVASLSFPGNQSNRSANVTNWPVNGKDVK